MSDETTIDFSEAESALGFAFNEMARLSQIPIERVIRAEAGSILKACAGMTKVGTPALVEVGARNEALVALGLTSDRAGSAVTINSGRRGPTGRVYAKSTGPRSKGRWRRAYGAGNPVGKPLNTHWRDQDWTDIQEAIADYERQLDKTLPAALKSIGLARQSWVQIADSLGIRLESVPGGRISAAGIQKAREAISRSGQIFVNGRSRAEWAAEGFFIDLINGLPYGQRVGLPRVLFVAMQGRAQYFLESVGHGVFESMSEIASRYPGFEVTPGSN